MSYHSSQGYLLSQLTCILSTGFNILYIEYITNYKFHLLGVNYFYGKTMSGSYSDNATWIDQVVPRQELAFFMSLYQLPSLSN